MSSSTPRKTGLRGTKGAERPCGKTGLFLCEFICFGSLAAAKRTTNAQGETLVQFLHIPAYAAAPQRRYELRSES